MYNLIQKMDKILNKGKEKILECFYKNKKEIYFSEVLRETKLTPNTTLKHLNNLKSLIISKKTKGNTFYRINNKNPLIFPIFSYFDLKRFNELEDKKLKRDIESLTGMNIQTFIIDYDYFKEQLLKKEDNVIIHAVKTGFVIIGSYYFYKEVLK